MWPLINININEKNPEVRKNICVKCEKTKFGFGSLQGRKNCIKLREEWKMQFQWEDEEDHWGLYIFRMPESGWQGNILDTSRWKSQAGKTPPAPSGAGMHKDTNTCSWLLKMSFGQKFPFIKNFKKKIKLYMCQHHKYHLNSMKIFLGFLMKFLFTKTVNGVHI